MVGMDGTWHDSEVRTKSDKALTHGGTSKEVKACSSKTTGVPISNKTSAQPDLYSDAATDKPLRFGNGD